MGLTPHEHARTTQKTAEFRQPQLINKVVDDRVTTQRQVPQSQWRFDSETRWWIQVVQQRTDTGEQMPQMQFQSVKQTQNPSPERSEEDRDSTVTACTRNDAIRNRAHEAGKDLRRARYSQSGCCQDCQRSSQRSRRQWRCRWKQNTANVRRACRLKETSRAKSSWHHVCLSDEDI